MTSTLVAKPSLPTIAHRMTHATAADWITVKSLMHDLLCPDPQSKCTLDTKIPCPCRDEMKEIEISDTQSALHQLDWLVQDSFTQCTPEAHGGATEEEWRWAMTVSLSSWRT